MSFLKHHELRPPLKVDMLVEVKDPGWTYDRHHEIADTYNLNLWAGTNNVPEKNKQYKIAHIVKGFGNHHIVIKDLDNGLEYIMENTALTISSEEITVDTEKIREEISKRPPVFFDVSSLG
jgi:ATP-dependent RNA circularization protein (DNA/RNA ligase family)